MKNIKTIMFIIIFSLVGASIKTTIENFTETKEQNELIKEEFKKQNNHETYLEQYEKFSIVQKQSEISEEDLDRYNAIYNEIMYVYKDYKYFKLNRNYGYMKERHDNLERENVKEWKNYLNEMDIQYYDLKMLRDELIYFIDINEYVVHREMKNTVNFYLDINEDEGELLQEIQEYEK